MNCKYFKYLLPHLEVQKLVEQKRKQPLIVSCFDEIRNLNCNMLSKKITLHWVNMRHEKQNTWPTDVNAKFVNMKIFEQSKHAYLYDELIRTMGSVLLLSKDWHCITLNGEQTLRRCVRCVMWWWGSFSDTKYVWAYSSTTTRITMKCPCSATMEIKRSELVIFLWN